MQNAYAQFSVFIFAFVNFCIKYDEKTEREAIYVEGEADFA